MIVVELDINGVLIHLTADEAEQLHDAAAAKAGHSAPARDLSLTLARALRDRRVVALQRGELRALRELVAADQTLAHLHAGDCQIVCVSSRGSHWFQLIMLAAMRSP